MIHEFALEPALVASWHDRRAYRFFNGKLGPGTKRSVCRYPGKKKKWRRAVFDAFNGIFAEDRAARQAGKKRLDALLKHLEESCTQRNHSWCGTDDWIVCALREHERRPFQGILVLARPSLPRLSSAVLVADDLDEDNRRWNPPVRSTPMTATELVRDLRPLLLHARHIRLVDPYFFKSDEDRWKDPLEALLGVAQADRAADEQVTLEIFTSVDREFSDRSKLQTSQNELSESERLTKAIGNFVRPRLTNAMRVAVHVWSDRNMKTEERLHNRWVLAETGGVVVPHGLDASRKGTDDLALLSREQWRHRCRIYSDGSSAFRIVRTERFSAQP